MRKRRATDRPLTARTTVTLEREQVAKLNGLSEEYDIPVSQIVRYSVGRVLGDPVLLLGLVHTLRTNEPHRQKAEATR